MLFRAAQRKHEPDKQTHTWQDAGAGTAGTLIECGVAVRTGDLCHGWQWAWGEKLEGLVAECGASLWNSGQLSIEVWGFRRLGMAKLLLSVGRDLRLFQCPSS